MSPMPIRLHPFVAFGVGTMLCAICFVALLFVASSFSFEASVPHIVGWFAASGVPVLVLHQNLPRPGIGTGAPSFAKGCSSERRSSSG
jgi:hypothetical protein